MGPLSGLKSGKFLLRDFKKNLALYGRCSAERCGVFAVDLVGGDHVDGTSVLEPRYGGKSNIALSKQGSNSGRWRKMTNHWRKTTRPARRVALPSVNKLQPGGYIVQKTCFAFALAFGLSAIPAVAAEYCEKTFYSDLDKANAESGQIMRWKLDKQNQAISLENEKQNDDKAIQNATVAANLSDADKLATIKAYVEGKEKAQAQLDAINNQNAAYNKRLGELQNSVPEDLKQKAQNCAKEMAPANLVVNLVVQGLAVYYTAGLSLLLPQKALFVDMGEVLHGNIAGGHELAPNVVGRYLGQRIDALPKIKW